MVFASQETSFPTPNTWNDAWNKCGKTSPRFRPCGLDIASYFPSPYLTYRIGIIASSLTPRSFLIADSNLCSIPPCFLRYNGAIGVGTV